MSAWSWSGSWRSARWSVRRFLWSIGVVDAIYEWFWSIYQRRDAYEQRHWVVWLGRHQVTILCCVNSRQVDGCHMRNFVCWHQQANSHDPEQFVAETCLPVKQEGGSFSLRTQEKRRTHPLKASYSSCDISEHFAWPRLDLLGGESQAESGSFWHPQTIESKCSNSSFRDFWHFLELSPIFIWTIPCKPQEKQMHKHSLHTAFLFIVDVKMIFLQMSWLWCLVDLPPQDSCHHSYYFCSHVL